MENAKYIVYQHYPFIFPPYIDHSIFARRNKFDRNEIQGSGFIRFGKNGPECYGKSISLDIKSREEDTECVLRLFKMGKYLYE